MRKDTALSPRSSLTNGITASLFVAMIVLATTVVRLPIGNVGGYIHVGDAFVYLAACCLPAGYAAVAASLGGGLADVLAGAPIWLLVTLPVKAVLTLFFTSSGTTIRCRRNGWAMLWAGLVTCVGYYLGEALLFGNFIAPLFSLIGSAVQAIASGVLFWLLASAADSLHLKERMLRRNIP